MSRHDVRRSQTSSDSYSFMPHVKRSKTLRALLRTGVLYPPTISHKQHNLFKDPTHHGSAAPRCRGPVKAGVDLLGGRSGRGRPFFRLQSTDSWSENNIESRVMRKKRNVLRLRMDLTELNQRLEELKIKELELKDKRKIHLKSDAADRHQTDLRTSLFLNDRQQTRKKKSCFRSRKTFVRAGRYKRPYCLPYQQGYYLVSRTGRLVPPRRYPSQIVAFTHKREIRLAQTIFSIILTLVRLGIIKVGAIHT